MNKFGDERAGPEFAEDMINKFPSPTSYSPPSQIAEFFKGRKVLVTGGSGFMGKLLIEKLLRSCPGIDKMYMFMRPKKGKSSEERFKQHFEDVVYMRLRKERPDFVNKVVMIEGDTGEPNLGLSPKDKECLMDTDVIFHGAATVKFDEPIRVATNINIKGTKELLLFAKQMPNLKVFVHISTAFSHCVLKYIEEKCYPPPITTDKLLELLDILDDDKLQVLTPALIEEWPNTYAFTKAIAEDTVRQYSTGVPTCIVRPSIMIATGKEPIPGWINNLYGPTGVTVGAAVGLLRTLHCKEENIADIIPADYVIAEIIVAAWDTAVNRRTLPPAITQSNGNAKNVDNKQTVAVFNSVSSCDAPITWGKFMKMTEVYAWQVPSAMVLWHYFFWLNRYLILHNICVFFLHLLPAAIVDTLAFLTGRQPMLMDAYRKIHKFSKVISYFSMQEWRFRNDATMELWDKLNSTDREVFNFNLRTLDWDEYFYYFVRGLRVFLIKDPMDTLEAGRVKSRRLKIAHYIICTIVCLLAFWGVLTLGKWMFSFVY